MRARRERPYLDYPERLEYPTETWAAQDMRKSEVFMYAQRHASGDEQLRMRDRAGAFFEYSVRTLTASPTRFRTRPVVLLLSYGFRWAWHQRHPDDTAPPPVVEWDGEPRRGRFVHQKAVAIRRARLAAAAAALMAAAGVLAALA
jgi:hypothetical protein